MIGWLHISDLHFSKELDARSKNFKRLFLDFCCKQHDINFVIATGDFKEYTSPDYNNSIMFLKEIINNLGLNLERDLFIVPGNHDVNKDRTVDAIGLSTDCSKLTEEKVNELLEDFTQYNDFARELLPSIYKSTNPSQVHVRVWNNKINILHLNTCLISDGKRNHKELFDINTTCDDMIASKLSNGNPTLAIGHHNLTDINNDVLDQMVQFYNQIEGVAAYFGGDQHIPNNRGDDYLVDLRYGTFSMPNIITGKLVPSLADNYSKIWFTKHTWNEIDAIVTQQHFEWNSKGSGKEFTSLTGEGARTYQMFPAKKSAIKSNTNPFKFNSGNTDFIGRTEQLNALQEYLDYDCQYPILWWIITGLGGSGKSRIIYEIAIKNKMRWHVKIIQSDEELNMDGLNGMLDNRSKNLLLIIDTYGGDFIKLAKWIEKHNVQSAFSDYPKVRVIFLRREKINLENYSPKWIETILNTCNSFFDYLYKKEILHMSVFSEEDIKRIICSYLAHVYPKCNPSDSEISKLLQAQSNMSLLDRPLIAMFLADAFANGTSPYSWDEDRVLKYSYDREKAIIYEKFEQAFKIRNIDFPDVFESIENLYAITTVSNCELSQAHADYYYFIHEMIKATGLSESQILSRMSSYGILSNGKLSAIEPDLVGEYFVLRRLLKIQTLHLDGEFFLKFFRDLYRLLHTSYKASLNEILSYDTGGSIEIAYAQGLFELTTTNYPVDMAIEAMKYLHEHIPDSPLAFGTLIMGEYMSYGLCNIIQRVEEKDCIPYLIILDRLYKLNPTAQIAGAYCRALMVANEGMWYTFVLSELAVISKQNYRDDDDSSLNEIILEYLNYLLDTNCAYTREQIESVKRITKESSNDFPYKK